MVLQKFLWLLNVLFIALLFSCKTSEVKPPSEVDSGTLVLRPLPTPKEIQLSARNTYRSEFFIVQNDTSYSNSFDFFLENDTIPIRHAFASVPVPQIMIDAAIQGRTYLQTTIYPDGTFSPTKILKGIAREYKPVQDSIDKILSGFQVTEPRGDTVQMIFSHEIEVFEVR